MASETIAPQAQTILPVELVTQIVQDYFALREAASRKPPNAQGEMVKTRWKILPLLCSCKSLSSIAIQELYRHITINSNWAIIHGLMTFPTHSLQHIKSLNLLNIPDDDLWFDYFDRVIQARVTASPEHRQGPNWTSSIDEAVNFSLNWSLMSKPRLEALATKSDCPYLLTGLLKVFNVNFMSIHGWTPQHRLFDEPLGAHRGTVKHMILHLDLAPEPGYSDTSYPDRIIEELDSLTISLGWRGHQDSPEHPMDPDDIADICADRIDMALNQLTDLSRKDVPLIFTPYVQAGEHRFCFPKEKPQGVHALNERFAHLGKLTPFASIEFRSECDCGKGDENRLWKAVEAAVREWWKTYIHFATTSLLPID